MYRKFKGHVADFSKIGTFPEFPEDYRKSLTLIIPPESWAM